jgi:hypothetical protein
MIFINYDKLIEKSVKVHLESVEIDYDKVAAPFYSIF